MRATRFCALCATYLPTPSHGCRGEVMTEWAVPECSVLVNLTKGQQIASTWVAELSANEPA